MKYWFCISTSNSNVACGPIEGSIHKSETEPHLYYDDMWIEISEKIYYFLENNPEVFEFIYYRNISNEYIIVSLSGELLFSGYKSDCDEFLKLYSKSDGCVIYDRMKYIFDLIEMNIFNNMKDWLKSPTFLKGYRLSSNEAVFYNCKD